MNIILIPLLQIIYLVLNLYSWALLVYVIVGLLMNFQIINPTNQFVRLVMDFLARLIEPILVRLRRVIPYIGPFDLSPIVLLLSIYFLQGVIQRIAIALE